MNEQGKPRPEAITRNDHHGEDRDFWQGFWRLADPKVSLTSVAGVYLATCYVALHHDIAWLWVLLILLALFAMEIAKNAWGDAVDFGSGNDLYVDESDKTDFSGGKRVLVDGLLTRRETWSIALVTSAVGVLIGSVIVFAREFDAIWIGIVGLALGWSYHGPPLKFAYCGLGELDVVLVYGPGVVLATVMVLTGSLDWTVFWLSLPLGLTIAAFLWVNQFPDYEADRKAGKKNLVVRMGKNRAALAYPLWYCAALALTLSLPWLDLPTGAIVGAVFIVPATLACLWVLNDPQRFHRSKPAQPMALLAFLLYSAGAGTGLLVV